MKTLLNDLSMKTITILKSTVCGGQSVKPGDVVEASARDAFYLIATKAAVPSDAVEAVEKRGRKKAPVNRMIDAEDLESRDAAE
jgi:hypothetical protein